MIPVVSILCVVGAYVVQNHIFDIWVKMFFGVLGFFMDKAGMPVGSMALALILGATIAGAVLQYRRSASQAAQGEADGVKEQ